MTTDQTLFIKKQDLLKELTEVADQYIEAAFDITDFDQEKYDRLKQRLEGIKIEIQEIQNICESIDSVMGVEEASVLWNLSAGYIKNLCAEGKIKAKKIGKTWIIEKHQPHPSTKK